jgi:hypothetical protein
MPSLELSPGFEEKILEEAIQSPAVAMMRLSLEIDRQLRLILAVIGSLGDYVGPSPNQALDFIAIHMKAPIPSELRDTLNDFWDLRNRVVHGPGSKQSIAMRSVDYGLRILRMVQSIPRPSFIVVTVVTVFSDSACSIPRQDVGGVILEHLGPAGEKYGAHIHPSRKEYSQGQSVSWEWGRTGEGWGNTWYFDPRSAEIKSAWGESLEFVGRPLDQI